MAIAHITSLDTSTTGAVLTLAAAAEAGNLVIVSAKMESMATSSGVTNDIQSATDSAGGNTWIKVGEYTQTNGVAGDGSTAAVFYSRLANTIPISGTITLTMTGGATNRALMADEFSVGGAITQYGSTQVAGASASTNPGSQSVSSLISAAYLAYRCVGMDTSGSITAPTATWSNMIGASASGRSIDAEFIISTATGFTSAPTVTSSDNASIMFVLSDAVISSGQAKGLFFGMF